MCAQNQFLQFVRNGSFVCFTFRMNFIWFEDNSFSVHSIETGFGESTFIRGFLSTRFAFDLPAILLMITIIFFLSFCYNFPCICLINSVDFGMEIFFVILNKTSTAHMQLSLNYSMVLIIKLFWRIMKKKRKKN